MRKVIVYKPQEPSEMIDLKKGDVFLVVPASDGDKVPNYLMLAQEDAKPLVDTKFPDSNAEVMAGVLVRMEPFK